MCLWVHIRTSINPLQAQCTWEQRNLWHKKWICDVFAVQIKFITTDTCVPHSLSENASGPATLCSRYRHMPAHTCPCVCHTNRYTKHPNTQTPKQPSPNSMRTRTQSHSQGTLCTVYSSFREVSFNVAFEWKWKIMSWRARNWKELANRHRTRSCPHNKCTCLSGEKNHAKLKIKHVENATIELSRRMDTLHIITKLLNWFKLNLHLFMTQYYNFSIEYGTHNLTLLYLVG